MDGADDDVTDGAAATDADRDEAWERDGLTDAEEAMEAEAR